MKKLIAVLIVPSILAIGAGTAFAEEEFQNFKRPNPKQHEIMVQIMENKDYGAWVEFVGDKPIAQQITEDNFAEFVEACQLRQDGRFEEAKEIFDALGLERPGQKKWKKHYNGQKKGAFKWMPKGVKLQ